MRCTRPISLCSFLLCTIAFSRNSYAASRDSQATLHISITLVTTIATGAPEAVEPAHVASSDNQGIIYNLRPSAEQKVIEADVSTSRAMAQEKAPKSINGSLSDEPVVEVTTVVTK